METIKIFLRNLIAEAHSENKIFKRNILKEYLQILVLDFIYSHKKYSQLVFYGGSCLAYCFGLPRLSEDLDFVDIKKQIKPLELAKDIESYFKKNTDLELTTTIQKFRIYLKFPLLKELGLSEKGETDLLFLKIEIFAGFDFCRSYKTEIIPVFKFNKSILIKTFDLPTLMATKLRAIFYRKWEKTAKGGKTIIRGKGRDWFDLWWYLDKNVSPNLKCLEGMKSKKDLKKKLLEIVYKLDSRSIRLDLEPLIENHAFIKNFSKNVKSIIKKQIENF